MLICHNFHKNEQIMLDLLKNLRFWHKQQLGLPKIEFETAVGAG